MKKVFLILLIPTLVQHCAAQQKQAPAIAIPKNSIGLSYLTIWNTAATPFKVAYLVPKKDTASTTNHGIQLVYSRRIYKGFFVKAGAGYYKQTFKLGRNFSWESPYALLTYTRPYEYNSVLFTGGLGYQHIVLKVLLIGTSINYSKNVSLKQKYFYESFDYLPPVITSKILSVGHYSDVRLSLGYVITKYMEVGIEAVQPFSITWNHDMEFGKSSRGPSEYTKIADNVSSFGVVFMLKYNF